MLKLGVQLRGPITIDHVVHWNDQAIRAVEVLCPGTTCSEVTAYRKRYLDTYQWEPILTVLVYPDRRVRLECVKEKTEDWFSQGKDLARALGARTVRAVAVHGDQPFRAITTPLMDSLEQMIPTLEEGDMRLALENHGQKAHEIFSVICRMASDRVGILFDPANVCPNGEDPQRIAAMFAPHIREVHAKNLRRTEKDQYVASSLEDGLVPWKEIIRAIHDPIPDRDIIIITELGDARATRKGLGYLRQLVTDACVRQNHMRTESTNRSTGRGSGAP